MHGGSGLSKEEFQTAVKNGIRKIKLLHVYDIGWWKSSQSCIG